MKTEKNTPEFPDLKGPLFRIEGVPKDAVTFWREGNDYVQRVTLPNGNQITLRATPRKREAA